MMNQALLFLGGISLTELTLSLLAAGMAACALTFAYLCIAGKNMPEPDEDALP